MRATATVFGRVEDRRFSKAAEGIRNGTYRTTITLQTEEEVRGFVKKGNDKEYGCTLTAAGAFCSCPDALYRGSICKHAVALALYVIRNPLHDSADKPGYSRRSNGLTTSSLWGSGRTLRAALEKSGRGRA